MSKRMGILILFVMECLLATAWADAPASTISNRTITVTGEGQVRITPDRVVLKIGLDCQNQQLAEAKRRNDETMKRLRNIFRDLGMKDDQVHTSFIEIQPVYKHDDDRKKTYFWGYQVNNNIAVTLKDVSRFDRLLSSILEAGVHRVQGIEFNTSELKRQRDIARSMATKAALEKATILAGELGAKVGRPITILEQPVRTFSPYDRRQANPTAQNVSFQESASDSISQQGIALGKISVDASVKVTFELKE